MMTPRTSRRLAALAPICIAALACHKTAADSGEKKATVAADVVTITRTPFVETVGAIGTVSARANHSASLSAPAQARISAVLVTTGQTVSLGQTLVELDRAPFEAAAASAQSALDAAQKAYDRQERLANEGIVPRKDAETAAADLARAKSDAVAAKRAAEYSVLRSPINGVVTRLTATMGASADPSQVLVEIADPSALDVLFSVTPTDAGRIHPGARVTLSAGQDASGEALGVGSVVDVASTVDEQTRSVAVRVQAPTTRRPMRIGETVFGLITVSINAGVIAVPIAALVPDGAGFKVFVVDATGLARERSVEVGSRNATMVEITEGLLAGERVATQGAYGLEDSVKVVPLKPPTADSTSTKKPDAEKP